MKILITGFDPFGGEKINPAYEAVKLLPGQVDDVEIIKLEVPTVFSKAGRVLEECVNANRPDIVLCVGQAGRRSGISVEKVAINLIEARIPDNEGNQPTDEKVCEDGETAYFATVPVKAMVKAIKEQGIPANVSYTAGTYVCNAIMYHLLYLIDRRHPKMKGGFIHVPYLPEQTVNLPDGMPSMSAPMIADALLYAVKAVIHSDKDIEEAAGAIM